MNRDFVTSTIDLKICNNYFFEESENKSIIVNDFLHKYHSLLDMFSHSLTVTFRSNADVSLAISSLQKLKCFIGEAGGLLCLEYMNEYETCLAIRDYTSCSRIQKRMFEEIDNFKEAFVGMIA